VAKSFMLTSDKAVQANLGCGSLILIALIVMVFTRGGFGNLSDEIAGLKTRVGDLSTAVDNQAGEIKKLREALEREHSIPTTPTELKKVEEVKGNDGATAKP
jgi:hypothetical protein